jgi:hypothetical protein
LPWFLAIVAKASLLSQLKFKGNIIIITTIVTAWLSALIAGMLGMAAGN